VESGLTTELPEGEIRLARVGLSHAYDMTPHVPPRVTVGHPVDVASGTLFHEFDDYTLPGRMPLVFARRYSTGLINTRSSLFGEGWASPFDMRMCRDLEGYRVIGEDGEAEVTFEDPDNLVASGATVRNLGAFHELRQEGSNLVLTRWDPEDEEVLRYVFPIRSANEWYWLASRQTLAGQGIDIERDSTGRILALRQRRERRGYSLDYGQDTVLRTVHVATESGQRLVLQYDYDDRGRLAQMVDAAGNESHYEYDAAGRMTREKTIGGMVYHFRYDSRGRCIDASGHDDFDRQSLEFEDLTRTTRVIDSLEHVTTYHWNPQGQIERVVSPLGSVHTNVYDAEGRTVRQIEPSGATTVYEYDKYGDRVAVTTPSGATTRFEFDDQHQITSVRDPAGHEWRRRYDTSLRLSAYIDPRGHVWSTSYDVRGDIVEVEDPLGNRQRFSWDDSGNITSETDSLGHATHYEFDSEGRPLGITDPLGHRTAIAPDAFGRVQQITYPDGTTRRLTWSVFDDLTSFEDELGGVTRWFYSSSGLLTRYIGTTGGVVDLSWGTVPGQLLLATNEIGDTHSYEYDADDRVVREVDFGGRETTYEYDADGQVIAVTSPTGRIALQRDPDGLITSAAYDDGRRMQLEYDARGYLVKADNGVCVVERHYDEVGLLALEKQGPHEIRHAYDAVGNRVRRFSSLKHETRFEWDANSQLTRLTSGAAASIQFAYDARQSEIRRFVVGGVSLAQTFDSRKRLTLQRATAPASVSGPSASLIDREFVYDATNNLTRIIDKRRGAARYEYDLANRVLTAQLSARLSETFQYDPAGNLHAIQRGGLAEVPGEHWREPAPFLFKYEHDAIVQRNGVTYAYDRGGRLVRKSARDGETAYAWNGAGELIATDLPDGSKWTYAYDPFGRRVRKQGPSGTTDFVWDGNVVLHEVHADGPLGAKLISWEFDSESFEPLTKSDENTPYLCVNDIAGMPRELVASDGTIAWEATPTTFGELAVVVASLSPCPLRFEGQWFDDETGLHYNRFRYFDPTLGRYISPDPIGLNGGLNLYGYVPNPLTWVDPLGLKKKCPPTPSKRGPKPWPNGPHNKTIARRIREIKAKNPTWVHTHGGTKTEKVIRIPVRAQRKGSKEVRRPDITFKRPDGTEYHENVGKVRADGTTPVPREVNALDDLERVTGTRPEFTAYN
jgi:RHS repeat-associated protein